MHQVLIFALFASEAQAQCNADAEQFWNGSACRKLINYCNEYSAGEDQCKVCAYGFVPPDCKACSGIIDESCTPKEAPYRRSESVSCVRANTTTNKEACVGEIMHCLKYSTDGCSVCENGFYGQWCDLCEDISGLYCDEHSTCRSSYRCCYGKIDHCVEYAPAVDFETAEPKATPCALCEYGYVVRDGKCVECLVQLEATDSEANMPKCSCQNNVCTFSDPNCNATDPSTKKCTECKENYFLDSESGLCVQCNENLSIQECSDRSFCHWAEGKCRKCSSGLEFDADSKICVRCSALDGDQCSAKGCVANGSQCISRINGCVNYNKNVCKACADGYILDSKGGKCDAIQSSCRSLKTTKDKCKFCKNGYSMLDSYACLRSSGHCREINNATKVCIFCEDGFALIGKLCVRCPPFCRLCLKNILSTLECLDDSCEIGYQLDPAAGQCVALIDGCSEQSGRVCSACRPGYRLVSTQNYSYCAQCGKGCASCGTDSNCTGCFLGLELLHQNASCVLPCGSRMYRKSDGSCTHCGPGADSCKLGSDGLQALSCVDGYCLNLGTCQKCPASCATCSAVQVSESGAPDAPVQLVCATCAPNFGLPNSSSALCKRCVGCTACGVSRPQPQEPETAPLEALQLETKHPNSSQPETQFSNALGPESASALSCIYTSHSQADCQAGWAYLTAEQIARLELAVTAQAPGPGCYQSCQESPSQRYFYDALNRCAPCPASLVGCRRCASATACASDGCAADYTFSNGACVKSSVWQALGGLFAGAGVGDGGVFRAVFRSVFTPILAIPAILAVLTLIAAIARLALAKRRAGAQRSRSQTAVF